MIKPSYLRPITWFKGLHLLGYPINNSNNFVAKYQRSLFQRQIPFCYVYIGSADPTCINLYPYLVVRGVRGLISLLSVRAYLRFDSAYLRSMLSYLSLNDIDTFIDVFNDIFKMFLAIVYRFWKIVHDVSGYYSVFSYISHCKVSGQTMNKYTHPGTLFN